MLAENIGHKVTVLGAAGFLRTVICRSAVAAAAVSIAAGSAFAQLHLPIMPATANSRRAQLGHDGTAARIVRSGWGRAQSKRQTTAEARIQLEVERRHSQLVITGRDVRRLAVTDSGICNYVQYSPTELAVVGLELGATDLMIWFEGEETPRFTKSRSYATKNLRTSVDLNLYDWNGDLQSYFQTPMCISSRSATRYC